MEQLEDIINHTRAQVILYTNHGEYPYRNEKRTIENTPSPKRRKIIEMEDILRNARERLERCNLAAKRSIENQMETYMSMARETFHSSMRTIEEDIERAIICMQEDTTSTIDYPCQSKNKEIIRKVYEALEVKINELEKENRELMSIIRSARVEKARLESELNEANNQIKMLEDANKKIGQGQRKEIIKYIVDYLQKAKKTGKCKTDEGGNAVKRKQGRRIARNDYIR